MIILWQKKEFLQQAITSTTATIAAFLRTFTKTKSIGGSFTQRLASAQHVEFLMC